MLSDSLPFAILFYFIFRYIIFSGLDREGSTGREELAITGSWACGK